MDWIGRRVLVTDGAGFLGASLCPTLTARGARVVAVDGLIGGGANVLNLIDEPGAEPVRGDNRDDRRLLCGCADTVFSLAAQNSDMSGRNDPPTDLEVNATAQVRLIQPVCEAASEAVVLHARTWQLFGRCEALGHHVALIENCVQAHGAREPTDRFGSFGDAGALSLYATGNLTGMGRP